MADLSIIIKALLQGTNIDQQIKDLQKTVKEKLLIGTRLDSNDVDKQISDLSSQIKQRLELKLQISADDLTLIQKQVEDTKQKITKKTVTKDSLFINSEVENQAFSEITARLREVKSNVDQLAKVRTQYSVDANGKHQIETATLSYYNETLGQTVTETMRWVESTQAVNGELVKTRTFRSVGMDIADDMGKARKETERFAQELKNLELFQQRMLGGNGFTGELDIFAKKQKGRFDKTTFAELQTQIRSLNKDTPDLQNEIKKLNSQFQLLKSSASQTGNVMVRALENAYKFLRYYLVGGILVKFVNEIRGGIDVVVQLDNALTELNKVADVSSRQLEALTKRAYELGVGVGRTGKEFIEATSEWVRAGYEVSEAMQLAEQSLMFTNIADGIDNVREASSSLISIMRGYKLEVSEVAHVVDVLNQVSNTHAVDTNNLTEVMKRSAGTLAQTGVAFEELVGLATAGYETLRSAEMVASGLNFIAARLKGVTEDGEAVVGLIPKIQDAFDKYTKGAVSVIDKQNGGLNSTYEILSQLSEVYGDLGDEAKAYLNEQIAGTRQNKVLVAIMENWDTVASSIKEASDATGSARRENEIYLESIQGKVSQFTSSTQQMWQNAISSDFIKFIVDAGTGLVKLTDKFGLLNTAIVITMGALLLFNKNFKAFITANIVPHIATYIAGFRNIGAAASASAIAIGGVTISVQTLTSVLTFGLAIIIPVIINGIKHLSEEAERQAEKVRQLKDEYNTLTESLKQIESQQDNVITRLQQLYSLRTNNTITDAEEAELRHLEKINKTLELRIEYEKLLQASKGREVEEAAIKAATEYTFWEKLVYYATVAQSGSASDISDFMPKDFDKVSRAKQQLEEYSDKVKYLNRQFRFGRMDLEEYQSATDDLNNNSIRPLINATDDHIKALEEEAKSYNDLTPEGKAQKARIEELISSYQKLYVGIDKLIDPTKEYGSVSKPQIEGQIKSQTDLNEVYKKSEDALKSFFASAKELDSVYKELNNGEQISAETLIKLIGLYPEYAAQIAQINNNKESAISLTQVLMNIERQHTLQVLKDQKIKIQTELQLYQVKTDLYQNWLDLMASMPEEALMGATPGADYAEAYTQTQALQKQLNALNESMGLVGQWSFSSAQGGTSDPASIYTATLEAYREFNNELEKINNALSENQRLVDTSEGLEQNKHLKDRVQLLISQREALNNLNKEQENQLNIRKKELSSLGFTFSGNDITNYATRLPQLTDEAAKKAEKLVSEFDALATQKIPQTTYEISKIGDEIDSIGKTIEESLTKTMEEAGKKAEDVFGQYYDYLFHKMNEEIELLEDQKDAYDRVADARIKSLKDQIAILEKVNAIEKEQEERQKRIDDIQKQKQIISNLENEKIKMYQDGQWVYVADPRKMREETDRLKEMETDFAKWESDLSHKKKIDSLQQQIETIEAERKMHNEAIAYRIATMQTFMQNQQDLIAGTNNFQIMSMEALKESLIGIDAEMYAERLRMLENFLVMYNSMLPQSNTNLIGNPTLGTSGVSALKTPESQFGVLNPVINMPTLSLPAFQSGVGSGIVNHYHFDDLTITTPDATNFIKQLELIARTN